MRIEVEKTKQIEDYRKALIRSAREKQQLIEAAGKSLYVLERTYLDNLINRAISSPIAVAETKDELVSFCHKVYGDNIHFDDNGRTPAIDIAMGIASFQIKTIAYPTL